MINIIFWRNQMSLYEENKEVMRKYNIDSLEKIIGGAHNG